MGKSNSKLILLSTSPSMQQNHHKNTLFNAQHVCPNVWPTFIQSNSCQVGEVGEKWRVQYDEAQRDDCYGMLVS